MPNLNDYPDDPRIPAGPQECLRIKKCWEKNSKTKSTPMWVIVVEDAEEREAVLYYMLTAQFAFQLKELIRALGIEDMSNVEPEDLIGKQFSCRLTYENDMYKAVNPKPIEEAQVAAKPTARKSPPKEDIVEDEVPF